MAKSRIRSDDYLVPEEVPGWDTCAANATRYRLTQKAALDCDVRHMACPVCPFMQENVPDAILPTNWERCA